LAALIPEEFSDAPVIPEIQRFAVEASSISNGLHMEFGVYQGRSLALIRKYLPEQIRLYAFDSFAGLPEQWRDARIGAFRTCLRPCLPNTELVEGWFEDTVPKFAAQYPHPVSFMHIDCDLYSSTKTILDSFAKHIVSGTIILFDELFGYDGFQDHEYRALKEWGRPFEAIARWDAFRAVVRVL
jgi:hypothetical protein